MENNSKHLMKSSILTTMNTLLNSKGIFDIRAVEMSDDFEKVKVFHQGTGATGLVDVDLVMKLDPLVF